MNGNLGDQLRSSPTCLSWKSRLKIANEIASVLTYLHTAFPRPIIHRDIYPGNFYLDQDLCAELSDFTLCMALPEGKTQVQSVVPAKALMPTMLVQEHKDKRITHTVHEVLTWFGQPCLRPRMRENNSTIQ